MASFGEQLRQARETQNITLGGHQFAVQPMWSNEANGGQGACAVSR